MKVVTPMMTVKMVRIVTPTDVYHLVRIALTVLIVCVPVLHLVLSQSNYAKTSVITHQILAKKVTSVLVRTNFSILMLCSHVVLYKICVTHKYFSLTVQTRQYRVLIECL